MIKNIWKYSEKQFIDFNRFLRQFRDNKGQETLGGGNSLVTQWLGIHLPGQGTQVRSLIWEPRSHMLQGSRSVSHSYWAHILWSLCPAAAEAAAVRRRHAATREQPPLGTTKESPLAAMKTLCSQKPNKLHRTTKPLG